MSPDDSPILLSHEQALLGYATEFLVFVDRRGGVVLGAGDGLHILGYDATEQRGEQIVAIVHPDDRPAVVELIGRAQVTPDLDEEITVRALRKDGGWVVIEAHVRTVVQHPVLGTGAVLRIRQIGDVDVDAPTLHPDDRFASLAATLPTGVLSIDADGRVVEANEAAVGLLRRSVDDLATNGWMPSIHPEDLGEIDDARELIARGAAQAEAVVRADVEGRVRWLHLTIVSLGDMGGGSFLVAFEDVTERHRATAALAHRATHDPLTGLPNRALLEDRLAQACARLGRPGRTVTIYFGDLDRFKEINDRFGHTVGDAVLREVAARLQRVVRLADTVSRLGGDEFVVVCEDLLHSEAAELADRIEAAVSEPIDGPEGALRVSLSVGRVASDAPGAEPLELLARADAEMYRRKAGGGEPEGTAR